MSEFRRPSIDNVELGDLVVSPHADSKVHFNLIPVIEVRENGVICGNRCYGLTLYSNLLILKKDGTYLVGENNRIIH